MPHHSSRHPSPDKEKVITKAVRCAADYWELNNRQLAGILGLSEASVSRLKNDRFHLNEDTKNWQLAMLFLRGFRGLDAYMGGHIDNQRKWLNADNTALNGVPLMLMQEVEGLANVVQYIDYMRGHG